MIKRHLEKKLKAAFGQYPVVTVTGPRQSGKTTLIRSVLKGCDYVNLEDADRRAEAIEDPRGFLSRFQSGAQLFSYIQGIVDVTSRPRQFVLSGSQNFLLMEKITQSLAGRCAILHLLPFGYPELTGEEIMDVSRPGGTNTETAEPLNLFEMLFKGFYPRIHDMHLEPQDWLANYYQSYIERDVRQITNIGDIEVFNRFVRLCAGRNGQLLNMVSLSNDCGVSVVTVKRWLSILETSFIIKLLRPHYKNFNKRLIKSPKLYFMDTGLLCYLLRVRNSQELAFHAMRGAVFESWIISELYKSYYHQGLMPDIYFWRDSAGHEIDVLIDHGSELIPVEIKSGQTVNEEFFKGLEYFDKISNHLVKKRLLVYGGSRPATRRGVKIIPWYNWR